jgi:hypothetical protein
VAPVSDQKTLQPANPIDEPANLTDRPEWGGFWSNIWPAIKDWLEEPVPEYDLGAVVWWVSGRAGEPLRLISVFQLLPPRPSVSRLLRRRSQHGLVCMLLKQRSSRMPYAAPRQKRGY